MTPLETALIFARKNKRVFPCSPENKRPLTLHGFKDASIDEGQVRQWWQQHPNAMIGMPTGRITGLWVVDCDGEQGKTAFLELCQQHGYTPATLSQNTPSGGCHYLFACPDTPVKNSVSKLAPSVDVRGEGGYIIVAPSVKADGGRYVWNGRVPVASAPDWLHALVCKPDAPAITPVASDTAANPALLDNSKGKNAYVAAAIANECAKVASTPKGSRNQALFQSACALFQLVASGYADAQTVQPALERAATESGLANDDGLPSVLKTIESGRNAGMANPRQIPEPTRSPQPAKAMPMMTREAASQQQEWPTPIPFDDFNLPQPDLANLPNVLRDFCQALSESLQVPPELPLSVSLASVATCVQGKFVTQVKPDYTEPVNIYMETAEIKEKCKNGVAKRFNFQIIETKCQFLNIFCLFSYRFYRFFSIFSA